MPTVEGAPLIADCEDDLITKEDVAKRFKVSPRTVDQWRFGRQGSMPQIPYLRLGNIMYFSKAQITWWLNKLQELPDPYYEERMRRIREGIRVGKPKQS